MDEANLVDSTPAPTVLMCHNDAGARVPPPHRAVVAGKADRDPPARAACAPCLRPRYQQASIGACLDNDAWLSAAVPHPPGEPKVARQRRDTGILCRGSRDIREDSDL